jgi:hypothetical protein
VLRIDEHTGQTRTLHTGRLRLGGFQHDLAAGDGALWALNTAGRTHTTLERFDLQSGNPTGSLDVPGIADALIVKPDTIWIATVIAPRTSQRTATTSSASTRTHSGAPCSSMSSDSALRAAR